jgi:hypothetical protein
VTAGRFSELAQSSDARLEQLLRASKGPALESLVGFEWRGCNTSWRTRLLGLQKFVKGFFQVENDVEGYNIPVRQNGLEAPWLHLPTPQAPRRFGFYRVAQVDRESTDNLYPEALLLDYGASPRNAAYRIERRLPTTSSSRTLKISTYCLGKPTWRWAVGVFLPTSSSWSGCARLPGNHEPSKS